MIVIDSGDGIVVVAVSCDDYLCCQSRIKARSNSDYSRDNVHSPVSLSKSFLLTLPVAV